MEEESKSSKFKMVEDYDVDHRHTMTVKKPEL